MSPVPADQAVRDVIAKEGDRTLFVEAGAGTGKTTQLVNRVVGLVIEDGIPLSDIAAITFTEAAAAELADRIRVRFEQLESASTDESVRARCRRAIADTDVAAISTLHAFAKRILDSHSVAAGLPPRVSVLDEVASQLAREERWERFVDDLHSDTANAELLIRASLLKVPLEQTYTGQATFKDVAEELNQSWDRLEPLLEESPSPLGEIDFSAFDIAVGELAGVLTECDEPGDLLYQRLTGKLLPAMQAIASLGDPYRKLYALVRAGGWGPGQGGSAANWRCDVNDVKALVKAVGAAQEEVIAGAQEPVLGNLLLLVAHEIVNAAEERRAEGRLEFHDLLVLARRVLRSDESVRRALHDRYRHVLLDEFQDTDPIQIELATLITAANGGEPADDWRDVEPEPGSLFFVGDPKQSIYRFRRADIALFLSARDTFGPALCLDANFRTVEPILSWVNGLFGEIMGEEIAAKQPAYRPLAPHRTASSDGDHRPTLLGGPHSGLRADELRELEAADVAALVASIRTDPDAWPVWEGDAWRAARLADVTILIPTRTSLPFLREHLDRVAVPYRLDTGTLVYDTQEVRDALAVLSAIDDPTDRLALVAALRSPLYACSDVDLFTWRQARGRWDFRRDPPEGVGAEHPVASAMSHLRSLWQERWWTSPADLLDRLLRERGAHLLAFGTDRPREVWRRLRFLVDQAQAFEEAGGGSLRNFIRWSALQRSEGARVHEPLLPETDDDAVRILTVHGAKGLEFPITILSGMTTQAGAGRKGVGVLWAENGRPEVRIGKGVATTNYDPCADIEGEMDYYEKLRLLYVACTRARDHLVVSCHHKEGVESYASTVWKHAQDGARHFTRFDVGNTAPQAQAGCGTSAVTARSFSGARSASSASLERESWIEEREALVGPQRSSRFSSATSLAAEASQTGGGAVADDDLDLEGDNGEDRVASFRRGRAGTAIGRAVHATLQTLDLKAPADIENEASRQADLEAVPELAGTIVDMVRSALDTDAVRLAVGHTHHKEAYVTAPIGDRVIEGYVDLLVETPDGLVVVDYKTDTVATDADVEAKVSQYALQAAAYAVALEVSTGVDVLECRFVFTSQDGAIERTLPDLTAAKQRVRELVAGVR